LLTVFAKRKIEAICLPLGTTRDSLVHLLSLAVCVGDWKPWAPAYNSFLTWLFSFEIIHFFSLYSFSLSFNIFFHLFPWRKLKFWHAEVDLLMYSYIYGEAVGGNPLHAWFQGYFLRRR
jgi:hypothetical protein